eukprot:662614-Rhodomonas_salina.9
MLTVVAASAEQAGAGLRVASPPPDGRATRLECVSGRLLPRLLRVVFRLGSYALATPCPVLMSIRPRAQYTMPGTDVGVQVREDLKRRDISCAVGDVSNIVTKPSEKGTRTLLRVYYAMPGTHLCDAVPR